MSGGSTYMTILIISSILLVVLCSPYASKGGKFGKGHKPHVNRHNLYNVGLTWEEAEEQCEQENAHLTTLDSEGEVNYLTRLILSTTTSYYVLIGKHDLHNNKKHYITVEEKKMDNSNMLGDEWEKFDKMEGEIGGDKCVAMNRLGQLTYVSCKWKYPFICES